MLSGSLREFSTAPIRVPGTAWIPNHLYPRSRRCTSTSSVICSSRARPLSSFISIESFRLRMNAKLSREFSGKERCVNRDRIVGCAPRIFKTNLRKPFEKFVEEILSQSVQNDESHICHNQWRFLYPPSYRLGESLSDSTKDVSSNSATSIPYQLVRNVAQS